ncbi:PTS glucose transporter subunit IIA [Lachnoclostridium phytofermentans]|uniref:Sugar-specific permease EIIA 1 domain n=1 Tax=Lachnoclostridium phytofermentans (strain ATCC 700394 / DSM 18823 / ISDg) TaxID=357809 RepID=A9KNK5_LACP7|nr:PTS glucose transporter subunit IIA [Lachnoclostridium phytofermentans]ABX43122.1 sugar-specific permease EIIA 1 domain [Lachnoclostridium phytofermentans ISDg]
MAQYDYIAIWVGGIALAVLVIMIIAFLIYRKRHVNHHSMKEQKSRKMKDLPAKKKMVKNVQGNDSQTKKITPVVTLDSGNNTSGNQRLDGARISHRRNHPDRVAEESMWKEKKEQEEDEILKKMENERKNKVFMIYSPCNGEMGDAVENVTDAKECGLDYPGVIIAPSDDKVYAPINGRISWKSENPNMVSIQSDTGVEVLLSVLKEDEVLQTEVFTMKTAQGAYIGMGEQLCQFTQGLIRKGNRIYKMKMELSSYQEGQLLLVKRFSYISHGDKIITLKTERNAVETA